MVPGDKAHQKGARMKREEEDEPQEEEEQAKETERATQFAACGDRKSAVNKNKQTVSCQQNNVNYNTIGNLLRQGPTH